MLGNCKAPIVQRLVSVLRQHAVEVILVSHNASGMEGVEDLGPLRGYIGYFSCITKVRILVKKYNPDLIHAHAATHYGVTAAFIKEVPHVLALWGSDIMLAPVAGSLPRRIFYRAVIKLAIRSATLCHSSSMHVCQKASEISRQPIDKFKAWFWGVIPDSLWKQPPHDISYEMKKEFAIEENVFLCGRGVSPIYRPDIIAEIIKNFPTEKMGSTPQFVILRGYATDQDVERFLMQLHGSEERFIFVDRLLNVEELSFVYNRCVAHVSIPMSDSLGGGVIEPAMAGSYPILSDLPGNNWFVDHYYGSIVQIGKGQPDDIQTLVDKLVEVLDREPIAATDLQKVRLEFCADNIARKMAKFYSDICCFI
jgi:glycosyltransferase involved in cell wall biosynthesis